MLDKVKNTGSLQTMMADLGHRAANAARILAIADTPTKNAALISMAKALKNQSAEILSANQEDMTAANQAGVAPAFLDRLKLTIDRIDAMANGLEAIADLDDPVGTRMASWNRPNGLEIERIRTPLGVIGVIFEARPNVTADAGALCLKAGNAAILRGGSDSKHSSAAIHACLAQGLEEAGLPASAIQLVPTTDREAVGEMLRGLNGTVDVIVPRGGRSLVERIQTEARVPVFAHLEGLCHVYVDASADLEMAKSIVVNSKMRRTGICGAAETLLVDRACADTHLEPLVKALRHADCSLVGDGDIVQKLPKMDPAQEDDWSTEYLDAMLSIALVDGVAGAIDHIQTYSSNHTEAVIAENPRVVDRFFREIDSAILLHNASTQFADGGEFGMGAEIGIATGKMHARGPVGVEQLTSFKYLVKGNGQIRS